MLCLGLEVDDYVDMEVPPSSEPTKIRVMLIEPRNNAARIGCTAPLRVRIVRSTAKRREPPPSP